MDQTMTTDEEFLECVCLLDGHRGVYVPQGFAENFDANAWRVSDEDKAILLAGPEHALYWDTWCDVLDHARLEKDGKIWHLHQDSDLFAVRFRDSE